MLKQLQYLGIVERGRSSVDERRVLVSLTAKGTQLLAVAQARLHREQVAGLSKFTSAEQATLTALLTRLTANINDQVP